MDKNYAFEKYGSEAEISKCCIETQGFGTSMTNLRKVLHRSTYSKVRCNPKTSLGIYYNDQTIVKLEMPRLTQVGQWTIHNQNTIYRIKVRGADQVQSIAVNIMY